METVIKVVNKRFDTLQNKATQAYMHAHTDMDTDMYTHGHGHRHAHPQTDQQTYRQTDMACQRPCPNM